MAFKHNDIIRLATPESVTRTGLDHMLVVKDGAEYRFQWGADYRVSSSCDPDNKVASLDFKGSYPLIHKEFANALSNQFTLIKNEED